jgi:hypothetical protein
MRKLLALAALGTSLAFLPPAGEARAATVLAAGDAANCAYTNDTATGNLINGLSGTVLALGDLAYSNGTEAEFTNCYAPVWGSFKSRTWPVPGNHEYNTTGAAGYFSYFGTAAKPSGKSYYRKVVGNWSVYALDNYVASGPTSAQAVWLESQLKADPNRCQIAYWHEPYISSGSAHGNSDRAKSLFALAYKYKVEIVLAGHDHNYERFAEMRPDRRPANLAAGERGVRLFTVGTGGVPQRGKGSTKAGSQKFANGSGVLQLTLGNTGSYAWNFKNASGSSISDSGSGTCLPAA